MLEQPKMNLRLKFEKNKIISIFSPYHAEYFMHHTSPNFYPVPLKPVFSISVENIVDPDKMASQKRIQQDKV